MPKTDAQLREDVEVFDLVERWGGWAVVAGLIAEFVYALVFRGGKSFAETWTPVLANALIAVGVITEIFFAKLSGDRRDELDRRSNERVAEANARAAEANARAEEAELETARLRAQAVLVSDALSETARAVLETAKAVRSNAVVTGLNRTTMELNLLRNGWATAATVSEAARSFGIIPKVKSFVGTRFDALATSNSTELEVFTRELRSALKAAYWIEIDRSDAGIKTADAGDALVMIHIDVGKVSELWEAAEALASALKAEGIEAIVELAPTPENSDANAIHIVVGAKAQ